MGLITKTVMVKWNTKNKKWYESKGYIYTKIGDEFEVRVEDLIKSSKMKIQFECDGCNKPLQVQWQNYLNCSHDGKYYCKSCSNKLFGREKRKQIQLEKSQSFYDWCYENLNKEYADELMNRWNYNLNKCSPKDVCCNSHGINGKGYWFKCLKHKEHESEQKRINSFVSHKQKTIDCTKCHSFAEYLIDHYGNNALEKYWDFDKNTLNPWEIGYGSVYKVWIRCQQKDYHDSYLVGCGQFVAGRRCTYCAGRQVHPKDSLGQYIIDNYGQEFLDKIWSDKNKKSAFEYTPYSNRNKVWWRCENKKHKNYYRQILNSVFCKFRCPQCVKERDESMLEEKVRLYLESLHIGQVLHEFNCTIIPINPKAKDKRGRMPFDNELIINKNKHLIIEVNGIQHYEITGFHRHLAKHNYTTPEYELHYQKLKDRYKRIYAKSKGYYYLAIPYWDIEDNENYKELINNKIKK